MTLDEATSILMTRLGFTHDPALLLWQSDEATVFPERVLPRLRESIPIIIELLPKPYSILTTDQYSRVRAGDRDVFIWCTDTKHPPIETLLIALATALDRQD